MVKQREMDILWTRPVPLELPLRFRCHLVYGGGIDM